MKLFTYAHASSGRSRSARGARRSALGAVTATVALCSGFAAPARAATDTWYDQSALATSCAEKTSDVPKAGSCTFYPSEPAPTYYAGSREQVSSMIANCTVDPALLDMSWEQTTGEESSIDVTGSATATLASIYSLGISTSYGHTWSTSYTVSSTIEESIPGGKMGWLERTQTMYKVPGRLRVHYNWPWTVHGKADWDVYPVVTGAASDVHTYDMVILRTRDMTAAEKADLCGPTTAAAEGVTVMKIPTPLWVRGAR